MIKKNNLIIVRGAGDLASGVIHRLYKCGYRLLVLECEKPSAIRRKVSFGETVYDGSACVEDVKCVKAENLEQCNAIWEEGNLPLMVDPKGDVIKQCTPAAVIDAIIAKVNLGTSREMAPLTIGLGPGFTAGEDVDYVVETMRGHNLGRIISQGCALANTGVPGVIAGVSKERVIYSPAEGVFAGKAQIAELVEQGEVIALVGDTPVTATITGVLRGIIRDGFYVKKNTKIADIDPRKEEKKNCFTISDKARCIAGSVVEILLSEGVMPNV